MQNNVALVYYIKETRVKTNSPKPVGAYFTSVTNLVAAVKIFINNKVLHTMTDISFVGVKSQQDVISERVKSAIAKGDVINIDGDDRGEEEHMQKDKEEILNDNEASTLDNRQRVDEDAGEQSSQRSNSNQNEERSLNDIEKEMIKECEALDASSMESEQDEQDTREGTEEEKVQDEDGSERNERASQISSWLTQLYKHEAEKTMGTECTCPCCDKTLEKKQENLVCFKCSRVYHAFCLEKDFNLFASDMMYDEEFVCPYCKKLKDDRCDSEDSEYVDVDNEYIDCDDDT